MILYILIIVGIIGVFFTLRVLLAGFFYRVAERREKKLFVPKPLSAQETAIQTTLQELIYFNQLSAEGKEKFILRIKKVVNRLEFSTAGNIEADDRKKVIIAASIVQITFGLEIYDIDTIHRIKIFENNIYNPKTKVQYKGLTYMNGDMYLSWEHLVEGLKRPDDGINLGLHETGHGLYILIKQHRIYEDFDELLKQWYDYASPQIDHKNEGDKFFLRKYADANVQEFFAICIENFFERPAEFENKLPLIYNKLCAFLNQNPINKTTDYALTPAVLPIDEEKLSFNKNMWHPSYSIFIFLSYVSIVVFFVIKDYFLETFLNFVFYSIPCIIFSYFAGKRFYLDSKRMSKKRYLLFCSTAISPVIVVTSMLISLNIPFSASKKQVYKTTELADQIIFGLNQNDFSLLDKRKYFYVLESNFTVPIELRVADNSDYKARIIEYTYHYGITGLKIYDGRVEKTVE